MGSLDLAVRYDTLVARGAIELYGEGQVRRWMGRRSEITVRDALDTPAPPGIIFWAVLREYLVGDRVLHQIAVDVATEFVRRHREAGTYVDFRTERALAAKQRWLDGEISEGELIVHAAKARQAATDVTEHDDARVGTVAQVVRRAVGRGGDDAVSQTYYSFIDTFTDPASHAWLIELARQRLDE